MNQKLLLGISFLNYFPPCYEQSGLGSIHTGSLLDRSGQAMELNEIPYYQCARMMPSGNAERTLTI